MVQSRNGRKNEVKPRGGVQSMSVVQSRSEMQFKSGVKPRSEV